MCQWAGLESEVEVFNLFAGSIPQEGLSRMDRGRKGQSIVPDLRISIPEEGNMIPRLHEIKIISSSRTRYAPHRQGQEATRAVDKTGLAGGAKNSQNGGILVPPKIPHFGCFWPLLPTRLNFFGSKWLEKVSPI